MFPDTLKQSIITPVIKKPNIDGNVLKNYRPVANMKILSKVLESAYEPYTTSTTTTTDNNNNKEDVFQMLLIDVPNSIQHCLFLWYHKIMESICERSTHHIQLF